MLKRLLRLSTLLFVGGHVSAQTLCGVVDMGRKAGEQAEFNFSFNGQRDVRISSFHDTGETHYDLKAGLLSSKGQRLAAIKAVRGENFYVVQGADQPCVLRLEQRDGVAGLYIEEHISAPGKPPQLRTEFIEIR